MLACLNCAAKGVVHGGHQNEVIFYIIAALKYNYCLKRDLRDLNFANSVQLS